MSAIPNLSVNAFGDHLPDIRPLVENPGLREIFHVTLTGILRFYLDAAVDASVVATEILKLARKHIRSEAYEDEAYKLLQSTGAFKNIPHRLSARAAKIASELSEHISAGESVLDLGCGEGVVGKALAARGAKVTLCDVYENAKIASLGMPFVLHRQGQKLPFDDESFDTALLLTVLHHSDDPVSLINEATRVIKRGGRLLVIESVYGVSKSDAPSTNEETERFLSLDFETQRLRTVFFDHLSNRIVRFNPDPARKVNVPFNFNTPENWTALFRKAGLRQTSVAHQGIDHPYMPVYHTFHSCERV